jgi:predicted phage tail protein
MARGDGRDRRNTNNSSTSSSVNYSSSIGAQAVASNSGTTGKEGTFVTTQIIDAICEGPIEGWPTNEPLKYIYLDGTPVQSYAGSINTSNLRQEFRNGTSDQSVLSQYTLLGAVKAPNFRDELLLNNSIIQQVQIRDDSDGAYPSVEAVAFTFSFPEGIFRYKKSGGRDGTDIGFRIEVNNKSDGTGTWVSRVTFEQGNLELTNFPFEWTFVVELPPGWSTPKDLQNYSEANKVDDIILFRITKFRADSENERAHNRMYLKNYSIYSRNQFTHPYTTLLGLTIDSNNFDGSIPQRMYDLKLLRVKVPSNYTLEFDAEGKVTERNYSGQWDGTFKENYWTDNPAWCFYDLVTNTRYGLGNYIDSSLLNKWKIYEIAKYCDAVAPDTRPGRLPNSYTFCDTKEAKIGGVAAASGNSAIKEPRFTCNMLISSREEAYSVVQRMAALFRGIVFFQQGTLEVMQDRPAIPTYLYNNSNVVGGAFNYSSSSIKARHTVAIIKWLDPSDLYSEKLEYVEDYDGIARYGYREIELDGFGCTSRGQARRIGRHILATEKFELETVTFVVGMEGGIVTPGNLIKIKDSYRQQYRAAGRVTSATSSYVTLDKAISVPSGVTGVSLWLQTAKARDYIVDEGTAAPINTGTTLRPTLTSYSITVPTLPVLNLSPTTAISPIPVVGNIWGLSYTEAGDVENTSVYKVISVVENNAYEYEITALQHYPDKYNIIEEYAPIPQYKPVPLKLFTPGPSEGFLSSKFNGIKHDITISWRSDRYISGTQYRLELSTPTGNNVIYSGTNTSFVYSNVGSGVYYFKVYSLNTINASVSEPLVLGPLRIKEIMPQNNFDSFSQTKFSSDYITNSWPDDNFPNDPIKYELWRSSSNSLRTSISLSPTISGINYGTNSIKLNGFDQTILTASPDQYFVEVPIYPYIKYTTVSPTTGGPATSPGRIVLNTIEKPNINIGDKLVNTTRRVTVNVAGITQSKNIQDRWITLISPSASIPSQTEGDIVYSYKGIAGVQLNQTQASGVIRQKTFRTIGATNSTNIIVTSPDTITNIQAGDVIINRSRNAGSIVQVVSPTNAFTISPAITGQTANDIIAYYQSSNREARKLYKYSIDFLTEQFNTDSINVLNYDNPDYIPTPNKSLMVNITKGKAAEVISADLKAGGVLNIIAGPNHSPNISDLDQVIFFDKDEVYTSSISTHIHPIIGITTGGSSPAGVTCTTSIFTSSLKGDILVNATRNTSAVILEKISNTQVTLVGTTNSSLVITGQTAGDEVFVIPGSSMTSFVEELSYTHPTVQTAEASTSTSQVVVTNGFSGVTSSYILYNMTRNAYASISPNTVSRVTVSPAITGQTTGDSIFTFLPGNVSPSLVTAPDGAFSYARPGDIFYNVTRDNMVTIQDVKTLSGILDKKIDRVVLSTPIAGQRAGDEFKIIQGFFNSSILGKQDNGTNDIIQLETISNLEPGDEVQIYQYGASKVGTTAGNTITDTGLTQSTTYYYWMRPVSARLPFLGGIWKPSRTTGDSATTIPVDLGNYNASNDNNSSAIAPSVVSPTGISLVGINADSTANINLNWNWTGDPASIDGFVVYFWSTNSSTDISPLSNNDFVKAVSTYSIPTNQKVPISNITYVGTAINVTTAGPHNLSNGDTIKIIGAKTGSGSASPMPFVNTAGTAVFTVSPNGTNTFAFTASGTPTGTYNANSGRMVLCKYKYQISNLTSNYFYNGWVQPYRTVNTNISENGVLLGSPTLIA